MKKKTSISVSEKLLKMVDELPDSPPRSAVIEEALILYFKDKKKTSRDRTDLDILNSLSAEMNDEAIEVLAYQAK